MIKVMSFNIRYGLADDGENHWERRKTLVLARIKAFEPDLLGLQECLDNHQAQFIREGLPDFQFLGIPRGGPGESAMEMAPVLFRRSRFELLNQGCFWLSETPGVAGSRGWDADFPRTATWAILGHRPSGRSLVFLNTHLDYQAQALEESARMLARWARHASTTQALVITGDFNTTRKSSAFESLTGDGTLHDAHCQGHCDTGELATYHGFGTPGPGADLDWILLSRHFAVVQAGIDRWREGGLFPSDHDPITAQIRWHATAPGD